MSLLDAALARDLLPDAALRFGIRRLLARRLRDEGRFDPQVREARQRRLIARLRQSPIALATEAANAQHYEVPTAFYRQVLGRHLKYSSAYWANGTRTLDHAEHQMLQLSAERAELADGQRILELGCGWGSMTLYMAQAYPRSEIVAVSNSASQREHIEGEARRRGLGNVTVVTADMNDFAPAGRFDRVVSIEMFEHMRNYQTLFARIASWLEEGGTLFVHVFCHRLLAYPFEADGPGDWMARYFFTGGLMPSFDLLPAFAEPLRLERRWLENGSHYQRTAEAWLANLDAARSAIDPILAATYGRQNVRRWRVYWRLFFLSCAELFGYSGGEEWMVAHYRFVR